MAAKAAARRALVLEPDLVEGLSALGLAVSVCELDWKEGSELFRKAHKLAPEDEAVLEGMVWLAAAFGRLDEAIVLARRLVALDPFYFACHLLLARLLASTGDYEEAEGVLATALKLELPIPQHFAALGRVRLYQGRYADAIAAFEQEPLEWERKTGIALALARLGPPASATAALQDMIAHHAKTCAVQIAEIYAFRNEKDSAFQWLERARVQQDTGIATMRCDPTFRSLHNDPRWADFLAKAGLPD